MPSTYLWRPLLAGALGHLSNPETIRQNKNTISLPSLETVFEYACANCGNRRKQCCNFARGYDKYQALHNETKGKVDCEMIAEENEIIDVELEVNLAHWRRYYAHQG